MKPTEFLYSKILRSTSNLPLPWLIKTISLVLVQSFFSVSKHNVHQSVAIEVSCCNDMWDLYSLYLHPYQILYLFHLQIQCCNSPILVLSKSLLPSNTTRHCIFKFISINPAISYICTRHTRLD